jgi:hypothetical protein
MPKPKFYVEVKTPGGVWARYDWFYTLAATMHCRTQLIDAPRGILRGVRIRHRGFILDRRSL